MSGYLSMLFPLSPQKERKNIYLLIGSDDYNVPGNKGIRNRLTDSYGVISINGIDLTSSSKD
jgi:hypothetical protein